MFEFPDGVIPTRILVKWGNDRAEYHVDAARDVPGTHGFRFVGFRDE